MSLKIKAASGGIVNLGSSGARSILTVDGVTGGGRDIQATPSGTAIEIKSTLSAKGDVSEGVISGSNVLILA